MKGKAGSLIITLIIIAAAIKGLLYVSGGQLQTADPSGTFSQLISGFTGIADLLFYCIIAIIILLIPYYLSKRSKKRYAPPRAPAGFVQS